MLLVFVEAVCAFFPTSSWVAMDHKLFQYYAVNMNGKQKEFGGAEHGDDEAALLNPGNKALTEIVQDESFREFEFKQYLFACQSKVCKTGIF